MLTQVLTTALGLTLLATAASAADPSLRPAAECTPRNGLPNFFTKLQRSEEVRVAYLGGSITEAPGWRPQSIQWFQTRFPTAKLFQINAAIGGTGSDLGVYRLQRDVLRHKPDLLFVEFAVNDAGAPAERIQKAMEGIVRQTWKANPNTDICFVYTLTEAMLPDLQAGHFPASASAMEEVADHYAIPSVHLGLEVAQLQQSGQLIFTGPTPSTRPTAGAGPIIFSGDGVHPYPQTGHPLYVQALARAMDQLRPIGAPVAHPLPDPLRADNWEAAKMLPISAAKLSPGFKPLDTDTDPVAKNFRFRVPEMYKTNHPGETISLRFKGTSLYLYDVLGPDCGQAAITVDGQRRGPVARFDAYCTWHRLAMLPVATDLPDGIHTVTIELLPGQPDKLQILHQRPENTAITELDPKKFDDTAIYPAALLLLGEVVK